MCFISFLVPIYNSETTLIQCLDSILNLSFTDFELILVIDGSTDNSKSICDEYAFHDKRIKVIEKPNGGLISARNAGLDIAKGKYILFCDSDDYYDSKALSDILNSLPEEPNEDILYAFNFRNVWPDFIESTGLYSKKEVILNSNNENIDYLSGQSSHKDMGYAIWDKIYCKSTIDKYHIRMPERDTMGHKDDWAEDLFFNISYCQHIKKIKVLEAAPYMLRKHGTPEEQNEDGLRHRIEHMMDFFSCLYHSYSIESESFVKDNFWRIVIWHLKRYFDLDCQIMRGEYQSLRHEYVSSKQWENLSEFIKSALNNWSDYGKRWDKMQSKEYRYFLQYLQDGNEFMFKLKNKLLNILGK